MLEALADFDDHLLEELLEEIKPPQDEIVKDLKMELGADLSRTRIHRHRFGRLRRSSPTGCPGGRSTGTRCHSGDPWR